MLEHLTCCPACGERKLQDFLLCQDHTVSKEFFQIQSCQECGFRFTNPRPQEEHIAPYYASEEYISHSNTRKGLFNSIYQVVRYFTLRGKVNKVLRACLGEQGKLLDIGCGTGHFLEIAKQKNWEVAGMEPDAQARQQAEERLGQKIYTNLQEIEGRDLYDAITLWHVLEHVHQLDRMLLKIKSLLKPGGKVLIAVPNTYSHDARHYQQDWAAYDVPRHLYHFGQLQMREILEAKGFVFENTEAMYFDAYYISMMSEKYRKKSFAFLKGLWRGWQSNKKAAKTGEYSSLCYIFSKIDNKIN